DASGEADQLRRAHADWVLALAESLPRDVDVPREGVDRIDAEHDNIRAALDRSKAAGDTQLALRLTEAVWRFWKTRGHQAEAERRFADLLAADRTPTAARARALNAAAGFAVENGHPEPGRLQAEEALAIHRGLSDAWGTARSTFTLGYVAIESGDFETAKPNLEEAVRLFGDLGDEHQVGLATWNLAWACGELGEEDRARALFDEQLREARAKGNRHMEAFCLDALEWRAIEDGRIEEAFTMI